MDPSESMLAPPTVPISSLLRAPSPNQDPIAAIVDELRFALDDLEETGALQSQNRMDIEALLNPPEESQMMDGTTDEEICQAVLAAHEDEEGESSDVGVEDDMSV
jgi:hypothetical protein